MSSDRHKKRKIVIEIDNIEESHAIAIEDLLATWHMLGSLGSSRSTSFFADGDGNFRPKIMIDGRKPRTCALIDGMMTWPNGSNGNYSIDPDTIAWKLRERDGE